jgi:hypothetical protein
MGFESARTRCVWFVCEAVASESYFVGEVRVGEAHGPCFDAVCLQDRVISDGLCRLAKRQIGSGKGEAILLMVKGRGYYFGISAVRQ